MADNILFFMVDQLSAKWMEAAMEKAICPLPNLRRLREEGVSFVNMVTNNPVCCPVRATIATGLTARGHGVLENGYELNSGLPTFMKSLQQAGYLTAVIGKCHLVTHQQGFDTDYRAYGFDVTHITEDSRGGEWLDWIRTKHPEHFDHVLATIWADYIPAYSAYGPNRENLAERIRAVRKGFDWTQEGKYPRNSDRAYTLPFPKELSQTEWITVKAVELLDDLPDDQPFFLQVSYVQPHNPYGVPAEYLNRVDESRIPVPVTAQWSADPHTPAYFKRQQEYHLPDDRWARKCYFADLAHIDEQLGILRDHLVSTGRADSTYILFTSDHGDLLADHGFYFKEERHYDACIRVPLTITGPGCRSGSTCTQMVQHVDLCPTFLDMAGAWLPDVPVAGPYLKMDGAGRHATHGSSLLSLCRSEEVKEWRTAAYVESYNPIWSAEYTDWARTIRTQQYRYTYYAGYSGEQLFDLVNDPDEQNNLANAAEYREVKQQLKDILLEQIVSQDWPKTPRNLYALGVH